MPPEGYTSVTLPTELVESIDAVSHMDRPATLRLLLAEYHSDDVPVADLPDDLREQLDRIQSAAETAEARTGRIEGTLDDLGGGR